MAETNPDLINLKIDGRAVTVKKGTNVLEAARSIGTNISYFCYHPGLSSPAVCRQCLVEVKGQPKLAPSCYTQVAENMDVLTESEKVVTARQQMLEFTLVNHPVDCPICDKAGECTLQKLYAEWDGAHSRVDVDKRHKPKVVDLGPQIVLDAERCILCTRCIRVCDEVAHSHQLEMAHRGDREQLTVAPGKQLDNPYSLNTVDVCPVGALTSKDFRFAMRAWELSSVPSVCAGCATGCNDEIHFSKGRVYRLMPRENQAVNKFWMCDEGRFTYHEITTARVAGARLAGSPVSLEKALAFAAERIRTLTGAGGASLFGVVLNAQATNEDNYALAKVTGALGIERVYLAGRPPRPERQDDVLMHADVNPNSAGARAVAEALFPGKWRTTTQLSADLAAGAINGLWILGDDVTLDDEALAAMSQLELCVYQTSHDGPFTARAQVVLPAAMWAEVDGTFTNAKGMVQRARRALEPPGEARPHHQLVSLLAAALGVTFQPRSTKALFAEMKAAVPAFADADFGREIRPSNFASPDREAEMVNLFLLFFVPIVYFAAVGALMIAVLGLALPFGAAHGLAFLSDPWFQALTKLLLLLLTVVMPAASVLTWMERKESALMQDRVGPNRARILGFGAWGLTHFVADAIKMIMKEDFVPAKANKFLYALAPLMAIVPVFVVFAIVPFGAEICPSQLFQVVTDPGQCADRVPLQVARLDVGLLFYFAIASLAVYGTTLAGWASYNKWSLLGGLRASSQMMSYEVTMGMAILGIFIVYGSLEPGALVGAQGPSPLHWGVVTQPLGFILFFTAAIAETKRAPFDIPEGESEVIGYFVEYSGMRFGIFFLAEFIEVVFSSAIIATVFFGGWQLPFLYPDGLHLGEHELLLPHALVLLLQIVSWGMKVIFFCWLQLLIRWTFPRFRPDQLMRLGWKQLLPASIANILVTAAMVLFLMSRGQ